MKCRERLTCSSIQQHDAYYTNTFINNNISIVIGIIPNDSNNNITFGRYEYNIISLYHYQQELQVQG